MSAVTAMWPAGLVPDGLVQLATGHWSGATGADLPQVAGFVSSAFSPLVATVADLCLAERFGAPPVPPELGERTGIVVVSATGDLGTSAAVATAVQAGKRVPPLLFYQSNHNAVVGHIAARWGISGPVVCTMPGNATAADATGTSPLARALAEAAASAALLLEDGDADAALVIVANAYLDNTVEGSAVLIGPAAWALPSTPAAPVIASTPADLASVPAAVAAVPDDLASVPAALAAVPDDIASTPAS